MALQLIVSAIYQTVRHSWLLATVAVKYMLLAQILKLAMDKELDLESFLDSIREFSEETVTSIVVVGFFLAIVNYQPAAFVRPISEFLTLSYFAYLFWSY